MGSGPGWEGKGRLERMCWGRSMAGRRLGEPNGKTKTLRARPKLSGQDPASLKAEGGGKSPSAKSNVGWPSVNLAPGRKPSSPAVVGKATSEEGHTAVPNNAGVIGVTGVVTGVCVIDIEADRIAAHALN